MLEWLSRPWPCWVAGPLIGLMVPALLFAGNKQFGISSNLRHVCAALLPREIAFFKYDWRTSGSWNLAFLAGIVTGELIVIQAKPMGSGHRYWIGGTIRLGLGTHGRMSRSIVRARGERGERDAAGSSQRDRGNVGLWLPQAEVAALREVEA